MENINKTILRLKVEINVNEPLLVGFWWKNSVGEDKWATIKYERLSDYCYGFGYLGHTTEACMKEVVMSEENNEKSMYGPWLAGFRPKPQKPTRVGGGQQNNVA